MADISYYKHLIKTIFDIRFENYNKALYHFIRMIKHNMAPTKKIINYDNWLENIVEKIIAQKNISINKIDVSNYDKKELILNTEIYDTGGHTEVVYRYIQDNKSKEIYFYQTNALQRDKNMFDKLKKGDLIKSLVKGYYVSDKNVPLDDKIFEAFNYIIENKITTLIANYHMQDAVSSAVLYLVKKYTNIEVIFFNHGDHWFSLGTKYADIIYTRVKNGKALTPYLKDNPKCANGKFIISFDENSILSKDKINSLRNELNIPSDCFLTMTGCGLKKLGKQYFKLINELLKADDKIYHLFVCPDYPLKEQKIKKLFKNNKRVILMPGTNEFEKYIQISDLYVDSFPQGGALTLIDFIKYKKPVVIKINEKEPIRSFEEYLYPNYKYAFKTPNEMLKGILELTNNKEEYNKISNNVWEFFEKEYISTGT